MVQRPSPESETRPEKFERVGLSAKAVGRQIQQPGTDDAATAPDLGNVGQIDIIDIVISDRCRLRVDLTFFQTGIGAGENVETFAEGCHEAVFDPVVDHLDKVTSP